MCEEWKDVCCAPPPAGAGLALRARFGGSLLLLGLAALAAGCDSGPDPLGGGSSRAEVAAKPEGGPPGLCSDRQYPHHVRQILRSNQSDEKKRERINRLNEKCGREPLAPGSNVWVIEPDGSGTPAGVPCPDGFCYVTFDGNAGWYFPDGWSDFARVVTSAPAGPPLDTERPQGGVYFVHSWIPNLPKANELVTVEHCPDEVADGFLEPALAKNAGPDDAVEPEQPGDHEPGAGLGIIVLDPAELPLDLPGTECDAPILTLAGTGSVARAEFPGAAQRGDKAGRSGLELAGERGIGGQINSTTLFGIVELFESEPEPEPVG